MALHKASDIVLIVFVSISLPIYITFIVTVLRNRSKEPFSSAFFTLCISLGVADLITVFHSYSFVKTAGWGWFEDFWLTYGHRGSLLAMYSNAMMFGMAVNQHLGVLFLSINRFTAIVFGIQQDKIWSSRNIKIAIIFQWIFPVIFVLPMSATEHEYNFYVRNGVVDNESISINFCDDDFTMAYFLSGTFINLLINVSTCSMYIVVLIKAVKQSKKFVMPLVTQSQSTGVNQGASLGQLYNQSSSKVSAIATRGRSEQHRRSTQSRPTPAWNQPLRQTINYQRELRLALSGFLLFLAMLAYFTFLMLVLITGDSEFDGGLMYNIVCDIFSCINPYTLLLMSKQTRTAFLRTLKC